MKNRNISRAFFLSLLFIVTLLSTSRGSSATLIPQYLLLLKQVPAPTHITATPISGGAIRLTWTYDWHHFADITGFEIEGRQLAASQFSPILSTGRCGMMATVSALTGYYLAPGMAYQFRIRAVAGGKKGKYSMSVTATTFPEPTTAPDAPRALSVRALSPYMIVVSWLDFSDNEYLFRLEQDIGCSGNFISIKEIVPDTESYPVNGLHPNQKYCYRVRAENPAGHSGWSNSDSDTTPIDVNIPNAPTSFSATHCRQSVGLYQHCYTLHWTDNAGNEDGFQAEILNTLNYPWQWRVLSSSIGGNSQSYSFCSGDNPGTASLRVSSYNNHGYSPYIYTSDIQYTGNCPGTVPPLPGPPDPVTATADSENSIHLTWGDVDHENGYKIFRSLNHDSGYSQIVNLDVDTTTYNDTGLNSGTTYYYKVQAWNTQGGSSSSVASATTESSTQNPPASPSGLQVVPQDGSSTKLALTWVDNSDNETSFLIQRSLSSSSGFTEVATVEANATEFTDNGLDPCTIYFYRIRAVKGQDNSEFSATVSARTLPAPPANLIASQGSVLDAIYLDWDHETCADGYNLYEMSDQIHGWRLLNEGGPLTENIASIYDVREGYDIESGIALFYRLRSVDNNGKEGDAGDYVVGWAGSPVPQQVTASRGLYPDKIRLSWKPVQVCPGNQGVTTSFVGTYDLSWSDTPGGGGNGWVKFKTVTVPGTSNPDGSVSTATPMVSVDLQAAEQSFPGVIPGKKFYFVVQSIYQDDYDCDHMADNQTTWQSSTSSEAEGWAQAQAPAYLPAPAWVNATDGSYTTKIVVSWASVTGAAQYQVYRASSSFGPWIHIRTLATTSFANTTADTTFNIIPGTGYFYLVVPVDNRGVAGYRSRYDGGFAITDVLSH